jgi:transposase
MKGNSARQPQSEIAAEQEPRGHGDKLERKTEAAIVALLAHPTMPEAAKAAGVSETTLWRWLQRDDFRKKYREAQDKVFEGALGSLQGASTEAVSCLRRNLACSNLSVQVQAAKAILDYTIKAREMFELEHRIAILEAALKAREEADKAGYSFADAEADQE